MNKSEMLSVLAQTLRSAVPQYSHPTHADWSSLERRLGMMFPSDFIDFHQALCGFDFPGDMYNVTTSAPTNGNDLLAVVYETEAADPAWPRWLIPFYGIGNGDYFAFDARAGKDSPVYYWYHERRAADVYCESFAVWLAGLEGFLRA